MAGASWGQHFPPGRLTHSRRDSEGSRVAQRAAGTSDDSPAPLGGFCGREGQAQVTKDGAGRARLDLRLWDAACRCPHPVPSPTLLTIFPEEKAKLCLFFSMLWPKVDLRAASPHVSVFEQLAQPSSSGTSLLEDPLTPCTALSFPRLLSLPLSVRLKKGAAPSDHLRSLHRMRTCQDLQMNKRES